MVGFRVELAMFVIAMGKGTWLIVNRGVIPNREGLYEGSTEKTKTSVVRTKAPQRIYSACNM